MTLGEAQAFVGRALPMLQEDQQVPELLRGTGLPDLVLAEGVSELAPDELALVTQVQAQAPVTAPVVRAAPTRSRGRIGASLSTGGGDVGRWYVEVVELEEGSGDELGRGWSYEPRPDVAFGAGLDGSLRLAGPVHLGASLDLLSSYLGGVVGSTTKDSVDDKDLDSSSTLGSRSLMPLGLLRLEAAVHGRASSNSDGNLSFDGADPVLAGLVGGGLGVDLHLTGQVYLSAGGDLLFSGWRGRSADSLIELDLDSFQSTGGGGLLGPSWRF